MEDVLDVCVTGRKATALRQGPVTFSDVTQHLTSL